MKINKKPFDGIDREILRTLYLRRPLVSSKIAECVGLSSPAISIRLNNLKELGIIKTYKKSGLRIYKRNFGGEIKKIRSHRSILWDLDIVEDKLQNGEKNAK